MNNRIIGDESYGARVKQLRLNSFMCTAKLCGGLCMKIECQKQYLDTSMWFSGNVASAISSDCGRVAGHLHIILRSWSIVAHTAAVDLLMSPYYA